MKILISADTSCLVSVDVLQKNNISVFPLNVIVDGEEFLDGVTINQDQLKEDMRANKVIKTSTPPLGSVIEYFENLFKQGYDHIIHFTISSKLSSMYNLFLNVANANFEGKITVIDS
jgi:DegV family protein with EDD domain